MNTSTKPTWSYRDERDLRELMERKAEFDETYRPAVRLILTAIHENLRNQPVMLEGIVKKWIDNADAIRDALAPFDSGIRIDPQSTSG